MLVHSSVDGMGSGLGLGCQKVSNRAEMGNLQDRDLIYPEDALANSSEGAPISETSISEIHGMQLSEIPAERRRNA